MLADAVLMVRPAAFGFNAEAAETNRFATASRSDVSDAARAEFDAFVEALDAAGVEVLVLPDEPSPARPDAVFPNNWITLHEDGTAALYPLAVASRRAERRPTEVAALLRRAGFRLARWLDWTGEEAKGRYLEGTGSLVLDRVSGVAWASLSPRTDPGLLPEVARKLGFAPGAFHAALDGVAPYHTNVILSAGQSLAVVCVDVIAEWDRERVLEGLAGREVLPISLDAVRAFAGNLIQLGGRKGPVVAVSAGAFAALSPAERALVERHGQVVTPRLDVIERVGGGSARCMVAEVFLPRARP